MQEQKDELDKLISYSESFERDSNGDMVPREHDKRVISLAAYLADVKEGNVHIHALGKKSKNSPQINDQQVSKIKKTLIDAADNIYNAGIGVMASSAPLGAVSLATHSSHLGILSLSAMVGGVVLANYADELKNMKTVLKLRDSIKTQDPGSRYASKTV